MSSRSRDRSRPAPRLGGALARASVVAAGAAAASSYLVARDQQRAGGPLVPDHPAPYTDDERAEAVRTYVRALQLPALAFRVPFAPGCVRRENGLRTGFGARHLAWDLHLHLQYAVIRDITGLTLTVDPPGDEGRVVAEFDIVTLPGLKVHVHEEFLVPASDCLIHRIDARITGRDAATR